LAYLFVKLLQAGDSKKFFFGFQVKLRPAAYYRLTTLSALPIDTTSELVSLFSTLSI